jgi:hypothetical protein
MGDVLARLVGEIGMAAQNPAGQPISARRLGEMGGEEEREEVMRCVCCRDLGRTWSGRMTSVTVWSS